MNTILVTGSNGYLGNSFINQYKDKYIFEEFSLLNKKIEDINFDNISIVLHCAALVHQKVEHFYEKYYEINVDYPLKLARLAKSSGVKQFIFISTIAVYSKDIENIYESSSCNPTTPYSKSKLDAEKKLMDLSNEIFTVSIIRPPMVYGKNAPGNIDSLIKLVTTLAIIPLGKIKNKRSFVYVGNLCAMIERIIETKKSGIFLACDDMPLSTTGLIELIALGMGKKVYLFRLPFFKEILKWIKPSIYKRLYESLEVNNSQTKKLLDFKNPYTVEEGMRLMMTGMDQ